MADVRTSDVQSDCSKLFTKTSVNERRTPHRGLVIVRFHTPSNRVQLRPDVDYAHAHHTAQRPRRLPPEMLCDVTIADEHAQSRCRITTCRYTAYAGWNGLGDGQLSHSRHCHWATHDVVVVVVGGATCHVWRNVVEVVDSWLIVCRCHEVDLLHRHYVHIRTDNMTPLPRYSPVSYFNVFT